VLQTSILHRRIARLCMCVVMHCGANGWEHREDRCKRKAGKGGVGGEVKRAVRGANHTQNTARKQLIIQQGGEVGG
jgi:hypothetical protein